MDKNEFRRRLEQLAELRDRRPAKSPTHNRLVKETVTEIDELTGEEIEVEREITVNDTLGFDLVKIRDRVAVCELGCGDLVANQVIETKLVEYPKRHWRTRCKNCDCFVSPDGQGFIRGGTHIQGAFVQYFKQQIEQKATKSAVFKAQE